MFTLKVRIIQSGKEKRAPLHRMFRPVAPPHWSVYHPQDSQGVIQWNDPVRQEAPDEAPSFLVRPPHESISKEVNRSECLIQKDPDM